VALHVTEGISIEQQPLLTRAGIASAANTASPDLAPGGLFTLFGEFLSAVTAEATASPLPVRLGGTEVLINGVKAPLFYVSPQQLNGQVPAELAPGSAGIVVTTGLGQTAPISVILHSAAPEFFLLDGQALALNPDNTINSPSNPAPRGSYISAFLTGQGFVTPPVSSGRAAPLAPLSRVIAESSAKIGGQPANLLYFGLAPGFVGLAQANIEIPAGVTGAAPLEIKMGFLAETSALISVK
jgi:adhesin/invasin